MTPTPRRAAIAASRLATAATLLALATGLLATPAFAHVKPDPEQITAGTAARVEIVIEDGCNETSPTRDVKVQLADGLQNGVELAPPEGWTASQDDRILDFTGPSKPADAEFRVGFTVTAPASLAGQTVALPTVQTCEKGTTRWIQPVAEGQPAPDHPTPLLRIAAAPAPSTTVAPTTIVPTTAPATVAPTTIAPTTAAATTPATSTRASAAPATTASGSTTSANPPLIAPAAPKDSSGAGTAVFVGVVALVAAGGGFLVVRARRARQAETTTDTSTEPPSEESIVPATESPTETATDSPTESPTES